MKNQLTAANIKKHINTFMKITKRDNQIFREKQLSISQNSEGRPEYLSFNCKIDQEYSSYYDQAKQFETKHRNLEKALQFYAKAAVYGQKINTCIKDFASVLHQSGNTGIAVKFLEDMKQAYTGDMLKYRRLIDNLKQQINPTGRHEYKRLLIDLRDLRADDPRSYVEQMFANTSRIKQAFCCPNLSLQPWKKESCRYILLSFDSFSAAKKTLETFRDDQWFGVDKYWVDINCNVICQALDGRIDFDNGILCKNGKIEKLCGQKVDENFIYSFNLPKFIPQEGVLKKLQQLEYDNSLLVYLIQYQRTIQTKNKLIKKGIWQFLK